MHRHQLNFPSALSLLVVKQWINDTSWTGGDGVTKSYNLPISLSKNVLISILGDTIGRVSTGTTLEGAAVYDYTKSTVTLKCEWGRGFESNKSIAFIIIGL